MQAPSFFLFLRFFHMEYIEAFLAFLQSEHYIILLPPILHATSKVYIFLPLPYTIIRQNETTHLVGHLGLTKA